MTQLSNATRKQASLDRGRMKNSNSSGGGQGCLTHGWLLLLSFLKPHCLLESFLSTPPQHIFIPQQGSVPGSGLNSCSTLAGLAQWHPYNPFRAASFFSLHTRPPSRGFQHRRRITPGRDVTVLCQEWDSQWHGPGDTDGWAGTVLHCPSPRKPAPPASHTPKSRGDSEQWKSQENLFKVIPHCHAAQEKCVPQLSRWLYSLQRAACEQAACPAPMNDMAALSQSLTLPLSCQSSPPACLSWTKKGTKKAWRGENHCRAAIA